MRLEFLLLLLPLSTFAQLSDSFNDGNFTTNTEWTGDTNDFRINSNYQLQLNSEGENSSFLSTNISGSILHEWSFLIKLSFSPSDNNQAIIYLASDTEDPRLAKDAYYLKFGKSGSDDAIELFRTDGVNQYKVTSGSVGFIKDPFNIRVKVMRDDGSWQIMADKTAGYDYTVQATGNDDHWGIYSFFSINCRYTSSNATKFCFDDIYAGPPLVDTKAPSIINFSIAGNSSVDLVFNEPLQINTCNEESNFIISPEIGLPVASGRDPESHQIIHLLFGKSFSELTPYNLTVKGVKDLNNNKLHDTTITFNYHQLQAYDIVINEIMTDPEPSVELPSCEYLELYNRTDNPVSASNWQLITDNTEKQLPDFSIEPHGYILITDEDSLLNEYSKIIKIEGLSLSNSGNLLAIKSNTNSIIHSLQFDNTWYQDHLKENGGWSLEMIDPYNPCGGISNWHASKDNSGGTPGKRNSVADNNSDKTAPHLSFISMPYDSLVTINFNEEMDSLQISDNLSYYIDNQAGNPDKVILNQVQYRSVSLSYSDHFKRDIIYQLQITDSLTDCSGNVISLKNSYKLGIPYEASESSLIINEVLYDSRENDGEFIEIYNKTDSIFNLGQLIIARIDTITGEVSDYSEIADSRRIILPHSYIVLCKNSVLIQSEYYTPDPDCIISLHHFPALTNSGGTIALMTKTGQVIDQMYYDDKMHFHLLHSTKGVSLERVNPARASDDAGNWHSASQGCGFATPGYCNSQYLNSDVADSEGIVIEPQTISPDNDGYNDQLSIIYNTSSNETLITIRIFDVSGNQVKMISGNHLGGIQNIFTWDGVTDKGLKAPAGIYIIHTQIYTTEGKVTIYKNVVVVASH